MSNEVHVPCASCGREFRVPVSVLRGVFRCPRCQPVPVQTPPPVRPSAPPVSQHAPPKPADYQPIPVEMSENRLFWRQIRQTLLGALLLALLIGGYVWYANQGFGNAARSDDAPATLPPADPWPAVGTIRVACVGDSITHGNGLKDRERTAYPVVLSQLLGRRFEVRPFAAPGFSALTRSDFPYITTPQFTAAQDYRPHAVVILLGTNDAWPQNWSQGAEFAGDYKRIVATFRSGFPRPEIYLCTPPPTFPGAGLDDHILRNEIGVTIKQIGQQYQLKTLDLHSLFAGRPEQFPDKIHPDESAAFRIAQTVADAITDDISRALLGN